MTPPDGDAESAPRGETRLRIALAAVYFFGAVGTVSELVLLEHFDEPAQYVPFASLLVASAVFVWALARPRPAAVRTTRWIMVALALVGLVGIVLHFQSNVEFELEMEPESAGLSLVWLALRGATPALAPGQLAQLGLIGFLFTFGHPALRDPEPRRSS